MADYTIETVSVSCYALGVFNGLRQHWFTLKQFVKETNHLGQSRYFVDGKEVTREEGNDLYRDLKKKSEGAKTKHGNEWFQSKKTTVEYSYEEYIEKLNNSIDRYTAYIDDYRQYQAAEAANNKIMAKIREIEKLKEARDNA